MKEVAAAFDDHYASLTLIRIDCEESLSFPRRPCERAEIGVSGSQQVRSTTEHKIWRQIGDKISSARWLTRSRREKEIVTFLSLP